MLADTLKVKIPNLMSTITIFVFSRQQMLGLDQNFLALTAGEPKLCKPKCLLLISATDSGIGQAKAVPFIAICIVMIQLSEAR